MFKKKNHNNLDKQAWVSNHGLRLATAPVNQVKVGVLSSPFAASTFVLLNEPAVFAGFDKFTLTIMGTGVKS